MKKVNWLHFLTFGLVLLGALNWGLVALLNLNLVNAVLGSAPAVERVVYILVGVSAVYVLATHKGDCKVCAKM